jgi:hypothetical protein
MRSQPPIKLITVKAVRVILAPAVNLAGFRVFGAGESLGLGIKTTSFISDVAHSVTTGCDLLMKQV